jgi:N-acetylmuramoyl-L-alanine amidase
MTLKYLVIHCTATPEGRAVTAADIREWHTSPQPEGRGWKQVGYTDMFHINGLVERLVANNEDAKVDPWEVTNGATGYNAMARHVVYVGGTDNAGRSKDTRTTAQKRAMEKYVKEFRLKHPSVVIIGHNEIAAKACPSFCVPDWLRSIGIMQDKR